MGDLVAFIRARLAEDEVFAKAVRAGDMVAGSDASDEVRAFLARQPSVQIRRYTEALRTIVRRCEARMDEPDQWPNGLVSPRALMARQNLIDLASIWLDHPDYDAAWSPDV